MVESVVQSHAEIVIDSTEKKPIRVLHVDDELGLLKVAKQCLEMQGPFQVDTAGSVEEALNKLQEKEYDAVVSDYQMPGKDGLAFLETLRKNGNTIPFIMFTGKGREEVAIRALNLGANQYLNKTGETETVYTELAHSIAELNKSKKAEEALWENEEKLRSIVENSSDQIFMLDRDCRFLSVNKAAAALFGMSPQEMVGRSISEKFPETISAQFSKNIKKVFDTGKSTLADEKMVVEGRELYSSASLNPVRDDKGKVIAVTGIVRDITERKKAEQALNDSEEKYRKLFEESLDAIFVADIETGTIVDCNSAASELVGREKSELVGQHHSIFTPKEQMDEEFAGVFKRHIKDQTNTLETQIMRKTGEIRDVTVRDTIFELKGKKLMQGTLRDITERKKAAESLRACGERFEKLFESQMVGVIISDSEGRISSANPTAAKTLGYSSPKELVGLVVAELSVDHRQREMLFEQLVNKSFVQEFEIALKRKDDAQVCVNANVMLYKNAKGDVLRTEYVFTEFSEHERVKEELKDLREKMDVLFEHAPDAYYLNDLRGKFIAGNKAAEEMTGYSKTELIGKSFLSLKLLPRSQIPKAAKLLALNALGKPTGPDEFTLNRKDGTQVQVEIRTFPSKIKNQALVLGIARDVTERDRKEKMIIESQQKFEGLFRHNPEAAVYLDVNLKIVDVNPRFCQLFGYSAEGVKGKDINNLVVPEGLREEAESLDKDAKNGYARHDTVRKRKDGSLVHVSVSACPVTVEGKLSGYVAIYKDITGLKNAEEHLRELNKMLEVTNEKLHVVGGLTRHDVRNKLSAVTGNAYLLKRKLAENPEALEQLTDMENAVRNVETIFEFARTYEKLGVEQLVNMNVGKAVDEAASLFPDLRGIRIVNECGGLTVLADSLLRQLFYNLIDDSLKYGEKLTQIRIHYEELEDKLKLIYEDDGIGISKDAKAKLFSEGFTTGKGSGYGLYLIRRMMDVYGWAINEIGTHGKGAQFTINVPKAKSDGRQNYKLG